MENNIYLFIIILYFSSIIDIEAIAKLYHIWSNTNPQSEIVIMIYCCYIYIYIYIYENN